MAQAGMHVGALAHIRFCHQAMAAARVRPQRAQRLNSPVYGDAQIAARMRRTILGFGKPPPRKPTGDAHASKSWQGENASSGRAHPAVTGMLIRPTGYDYALALARWEGEGGSLAAPVKEFGVRLAGEKRAGVGPVKLLADAPLRAGSRRAQAIRIRLRDAT
jgi:hypothetical protein